MKEIWNWLIKNFSNLFTVIGIILTVYFSLFYVPHYIRENENERAKNINSDLIQSVQEVLYNNYDLNQNQIEALIKGKEIKFKVNYAFSPNELLIQTQETFMANKFIPLNERIKVVKKIDSIRSVLKINNTGNEIKKENKFFSLDNKKLYISILSIMIGLLSGVVGIWSLGVRLKKDRTEIINDKVELEKESIQDRIIETIRFEKMIKSIFVKNQLNYKRLNEEHDLGFNYIIRINENLRIAVKIKYISSHDSLNINSFYKLFQPIKNNKNPRIIILNRKDAKLHYFLTKLFKQDDGRPHLIISNQIDKIETELLTIINNYSQQSRA